MAVVKLAQSKKSIHFIDDQGNVFFTSVAGFSWMLPNKCPKCHHEYGGSWNKPILFKRFPNPVPPDKFQVSEVYDPSGSTLKTENAYDPKYLKERAAAAAYTDKVIE